MEFYDEILIYDKSISC